MDSPTTYISQQENTLSLKEHAFVHEMGVAE